MPYHDTTTESFGMDDLGNRGTVGLRDNTTDTYVVQPYAANEYASIDSVSLTYDNAGNMTADHRGFEYEYDYENRLVKVTNPGQSVTVAEFDYDALGRRIRRGKYDSQGWQNRLYYYNDNWQVLEEYSIGSSGSGMVWRCVYGNYIDEPLVRSGGATFFYIQDHLYSTAALLNYNGSIAERYEYDAYGNATIWDASFSTTYDRSPNFNEYTFTGRRLDSLHANQLKLMYYRHRYYDPQMGRFLTRDPLGIVPNSKETVMSPYAAHWLGLNLFTGQNLYEYTYSAPLIYLDPAGLFGQCGPGFIGGIIVPDDPWPFGGANFTEACKAHDDCYGGEGPNGCRADKEECDDAFRDAMYAACDAKYGDEKDWFGNPRADWCKEKIADTYYGAVDDHGDASWEKGQENGNCPDPCPGATPGIGPGGNGGGVIRDF
ncbi:Cell wall-associated polypeptide CWBP200 [Anaerohalosphaera lusitana]|uniref:Cell wall-associated polypeptide CWBP200 n=1 Tax=Anaerohalosphaera lusitana TaxID=1936003 RepID=A0A1U9NGS5_9BACT|nr:RHS repeat-associated core domain-containing protein [Anaerohalosphaera lusitana]AQT67129.1 Cell wall-associated polypeptide CWBP200 [Anaerohalosphaera lusitana]